MLYDIGTKLISYDKTSCSVELIYLDVVVKRTKRPNRLTLVKDGTMFEDAVAQSIINETFGTNFDIVSYVQQNNYRSFILMNPNDKLSFLEQLAFGECDIKRLRNECKTLITEQNEKLSEITTKLKMASSTLEGMTLPIEVPFPLKGKNKEVAIRNEQIRKKNTETLLKRANATFAVINTKLRSLKRYQDVLKASNFQQDEARLAELSFQTEDSVFEKRDKLLLQRDYNDKLKEIENLVEIEENEMREIIKTPVDPVSDEEISSIREIISDKKRVIGLEKRLVPLSTNVSIESIEKSIVQYHRYECPTCQTELYIDGDKLMNVSEHHQTDTLEELETTLTELKTHLKLTTEINAIKNSYDNELPPLKELEELLSSRLKEAQLFELQQQARTKLKNRQYSKSLQISIKNLELLKTKIGTFIDGDIDELDVKLEQLKEASTISARLKKNREMLKEYLIDENENELSEECRTQEQLIKELTEKLQVHTDNVDKLEAYQSYMSSLVPYQTWENRVKELRREEKLQENRCACAYKLKEKIHLAESVIIGNIIENINVHLNEYLEVVFDSTFSCQLTTTKETLKGETKTQLGFEITYKGGEADLNSLSGGEMARLCLCGTLALSAISGSKLLMLDEATSSLDINLNEIVLEMVKKEFGDKLVLIISHQVSTDAIFDRVIKV